jgi:hypothetical protein
VLGSEERAPNFHRLEKAGYSSRNSHQGYERQPHAYGGTNPVDTHRDHQREGRRTKKPR